MYISTNALTSSMRASTMNTQSELATVQKELSSGTYADLGTTLGGSSGRLVSLTQDGSRLAAYTASNALATTRLSTTESTLKSMQSTAQSFLNDLTTAATGGGLGSTLVSTAGHNLTGTIAALNTTVGQDAIFGGINTSSAPVAAYTATSAAKTGIDAAFQAKFGFAQTDAAASTVTADQMTDFLNNEFANLFSASSYQTSWSSASSTAQSSTIAPNQTITTSVTANADALRQLTEAYTMVTEFTTNSQLGASAQQAVVKAATGVLHTSVTGMTDLQSTVGLAQNQVSAATDQIAAQTSVLTTETSGLHDVDVYALDTRLQNLQTQIQASYELTTQLKQLSLTQYLG